MALFIRSLALAALLAPATGFSIAPSSHGISRASTTQLQAEGGAPQYDRRSASVLSNSQVGKGSYLIRVSPDDDDGAAVDYEPGHVLALEIRNPDGKGDESASVAAGQEYMRGPYTVSRCDGNSFDVMYRVVGKKTEVFRAAEKGTHVQFGGKFKVPILEGIDKTDLERVVLISTGVGVGPMIGFVEQALQLPDDDLFAKGGRIELYAGFRDEEDACCVTTLDELAAAHPDRFSWTPVISSKVGRTSDAKTLALIAEGLCKVAPGSTHYHCIGNGSMVNEFKEGLAKAGVSEERLTLEMYFNHKEPVNTKAVDAIGEALKESVAVEA